MAPLVLLEACQGLLGEQVSKQPKGLSLRQHSNVGTEGGDFLFHSIVAICPMTTWQIFQDDPDPKPIDLTAPNLFPHPVGAEA